MTSEEIESGGWSESQLALIRMVKPETIRSFECFEAMWSLEVAYAEGVISLQRYAAQQGRLAAFELAKKYTRGNR